MSLRSLLTGHNWRFTFLERKGGWWVRRLTPGLGRRISNEALKQDGTRRQSRVSVQSPAVKCLRWAHCGPGPGEPINPAGSEIPRPCSYTHGLLRIHHGITSDRMYIYTPYGSVQPEALSHASMASQALLAALVSRCRRVRNTTGPRTSLNGTAVASPALALFLPSWPGTVELPRSDECDPVPPHGAVFLS